MQRSTLITELLSVSESSSNALAVAARPRRVLRHRVLLVGTLLLACGCQTPNSLTSMFKKTKPIEKRSLLAIIDEQKQDADPAGLPLASKAKSQGGALTRLLDRGQDSLATYYEDSNPSHLADAHRCYEQALAQDPRNSESHHGMAIVCDLQKDYLSAELHYRAALRDDPDNGKILGDLGYSYLLQGRLPESETTLTQATKRDPGNTQAYKNLAYVYAKQGNFNLADATFRRVMNEDEVRQEMAQLFPNGRPEVAESGDRSKLPWQGKDPITTDEFAQKMTAARDQNAADWQRKKSALEQASSPALTIEQQKATIAQLEWERDQAYRMAEARTQQSSNQPLVLGGPSTPSERATPGQQPQMQNGASPGNSSDGQFYAGTQQQLPPIQPPNYQGGRRVRNELYPSGTPPQVGQNRNEIQQATGQNQEPGPNGRRPVDQAYLETNRGVDPRTGRPLNSGIQQMEGQQPLLVPQGLDNSTSGPNLQGASPVDRIATFEDAKRRAAMAGLGGSEMMFPMPTIEGAQRIAPGTGGTFGGSGFPQPQRMLPMDAAPHDLNLLMQAPSGQMTVQPNNMGMLNSPTGPSFSQPNFEQRLAPQIPLVSPLGNQGTNYQDQADAAQQSRTYQPAPQFPQSQDPRNGEMTISPQSQGDSGLRQDSRNQVNSELYQYGQSFRNNPAQQNDNAWNQTPTSAYGVPNQPQTENPNQLVTPDWNQQQLAPRMTPPPYPGRPSQFGDEQSSQQRSDGGAFGDSSSQYSNSGAAGSVMAGASYSEPPAIYSPGIRVPAAYGNGNRSESSSGQSRSFNVPRITPAGR